MSTCPQEWRDQLGLSLQTLTLSLTDTVVSVETSTWGALKARYRQ